MNRFAQHLQMRIAYAAQSYPPMVSGAAIAVQRLAEGMAQRGHEVLVLSASDTGHAYITSSDHFRLSRLGSLPNPFRVGQRFVLWPRRAVRAELSAFKPHILHAHDPLGVGMMGIRVARSFGIPTLLTAHALPWLVPAYLPNVAGLRRAVESVLWVYARWLSRQCNRLIVPTHAIAAVMRDHGIDLPEVIWNGVSPLFSPHPASPNEAAALRRKYGLDPDLPIILYVGRIDPDKRVELVVQAAARLSKSVKAQLLVVGDGTRRDAVMELSRALGISDRAKFPGFVSGAGDLPGLYRLASAFVTVGEVETQCLTALEALTTGVPVVSVKTDVMAEMIQDGVDGFLVTPGDVNAIADRLAFLLQNPEAACAMGLVGQAVAKRQSLQQMLQEHEELYLEMLHGRRTVA